MRVLRCLSLILGVTAGVVGSVHAQSVSKTGTFADWSLYTDERKPHQFCFVTAEPKSSEPPDAARELPHLYISAWPKDGVKAEVSVFLGFPSKKNTEVTANVAPANFRMTANDDRAYVHDATQELKLVDAMKKGSKMAIAATTQTGTAVIDHYSLSGLGQALQELQTSCF